jgi:integrase
LDRIQNFHRQQRRELVGTSSTEANLAYSKRTVQKVEKPSILERPKESSLTFAELTAWYLGDKLGDKPINGKTYDAMKALAYYRIVKYNLASFNEFLGNVVVGQIEKIDIENYQTKRRNQGYSDAYIDYQVGAARSMVKSAWENNLIGGQAVKVFSMVKRMLKPNGNARNKVLTVQEYLALSGACSGHIKLVVDIAFWTGMRCGEILGLTWDRIDLGRRLIYLESVDTKQGQAKDGTSKTLLKTLVRLPNRLQATSDTIDGNHVVMYRGKPVAEVRKGLRNGCKRVDIPFGRNQRNDFTLHDMRHTFATTARKAGVARNVIMANMGHSSGTDMNLRYDTVDETDLLDAVERLEGFVKDKAEDVTKVLPAETSEEIANC